MRVAAAISTWLVIGFLAVFAMGGAASAEMITIEPDDFSPAGTLLNNPHPLVTLSNQTTRGDPDETDVLVRGIGTDIPMTGVRVFGRETAPPPSRNLIIWSQFLSGPTDLSAALRADFIVPADFVRIPTQSGH